MSKFEFRTPNFSVDLSRLKISGKPSKQACERADRDYSAWVKSDFAGFRAVLEPGSKAHPDLAAIQAEANRRRQGTTRRSMRNLVVLGTGGSSLGAEAIVTALVPVHSEKRFFFMDNNDPAYFAEHLRLWDPEETLFYAVSKSGSTPETWSQMLVAIDWLKRALTKSKESADAWKQHIVLCSDPEKGDFRAFALKQGLTCLDVPSSVGGRFSVLTPVGLFVTAWAGLRNQDLFAGARELVDAWENKALVENPAFLTAWALAEEKSHRVTVAFSYSSHLRAFGRWFAQLWGESLGKSGKGFTPYAAVGTTDQHSQAQLYMEGPHDKVFAFHHVAKPSERLLIPMAPGAEKLASANLLAGKTMHDLFDAEFRATRDAISETGALNFTVTLPELSERAIGALLYFWEWVTAYSGSLLEIDPFTQPGVEKGKILTKEYLRS